MVQRQRFRLAVALCTMAMATACFSGGGDQKAGETSSGQQSDKQVEAGVPQEYRAKAIADGKNRAIDACGLHDPDAAKEVTGDEGDEIVPSTSGLQECILRMHKGEFQSTWTFYLEVGVLYDAASRKNDAPEKLGGMDVFISEDERRCEVSKPLDDNYVIQLHATASGEDNAPAKPVCQVLREYATKLAPVWQELPKHGSGRTKPELTLPKLDPCTAAAATMDMFEEGFLETSGPMTCTARSAKPSPPVRDRSVGRNEVSVTWTMNTNPAKLIKAGDNSAREITVEGRKAVISKGSSGCTTYIVWDPEISVVQDNRSTDDDSLTQQIRVQTATCDTAEEVTKRIVAKVGKR